MNNSGKFTALISLLLIAGCGEQPGGPYEQPYNHGVKLFEGTLSAVSPDEMTIAVQKSDTVNSVNIFVCNSDGGNLRLIARGGEHPAFSPDGRTIAFSRYYYFTTPQGDYKHFYRLLTIDLATLQENIILNDSAAHAIDQIRWSPNGTMIAFHYDSSGYNRMKIVSAAALNSVYNTFNAEYFQWAPDGNRFVCLQGHGYNMFIGSVGTDVREQIGIGYGLDFPLWLPDGNTIAYLQSYAGNLVYHYVAEKTDSIHAMDFHEKKWSRKEEAFSPDGKKILSQYYQYGLESPNYFQLSYYDIVSERTVDIALDNYDLGRAYWSASSQTIYYTIYGSMKASGFKYTLPP